MKTLNSVTLANKKSIAVLLAGLLAAVVLGFTGPVAAVQSGESGESGPSAPEATCPPGGQCFADVLPDSPFYAYTNNLYMDDIVSGYACGGPGEPCDDQNRPYYRPGNNVTRAQMTKFVDLARNVPGTANRAGAIAYASVGYNGHVMRGTSNVTSTYNAAQNWYEITIAGEDYYFPNYVAIVTPSNNTPLLATVGSVDNKLLVMCHTLSGSTVQCDFQVVVYKP